MRRTLIIISIIIQLVFMTLCFGHTPEIAISDSTHFELGISLGINPCSTSGELTSNDYADYGFTGYGYDITSMHSTWKITTQTFIEGKIYLSYWFASNTAIGLKISYGSASTKTIATLNFNWVYYSDSSSGTEVREYTENDKRGNFSSFKFNPILQLALLRNTKGAYGISFGPALFFDSFTNYLDLPVTYATYDYYYYHLYSAVKTDPIIHSGSTMVFGASIGFWGNLKIAKNVSLGGELSFDIGSSSQYQTEVCHQLGKTIITFQGQDVSSSPTNITIQSTESGYLRGFYINAGIAFSF